MYTFNYILIKMVVVHKLHNFFLLNKNNIWHIVTDLIVKNIENIFIKSIFRQIQLNKISHIFYGFN